MQKNGFLWEILCERDHWDDKVEFPAGELRIDYIWFKLPPQL